MEKDKSKDQFTSQKQMFLHIWMSLTTEERVCSNCSKWLGEMASPYFFDHIISKGARPDLKLDPDNIQLLCVDCHTAKHHNPYIFRQRAR